MVRIDLTRETQLVVVQEVAEVVTSREDLTRRTSMMTEEGEEEAQLGITTNEKPKYIQKAIAKKR